MEIIPVIDLMRGRVVHAEAGQRHRYDVIDSVLTKANDLLTVVADIVSFFPFKTFYIADLDAIAGQKINVILYRQCLEKFPQITFWLDAGLRDKDDWQPFVTSNSLVPVLGSESIASSALVADMKSCILSLDFKQGQFLGNKAILQQPQYWPERVIVMNLDRVGVELGPDFSLIAEVGSKKSNVQLIAAGGVRNQDDLLLLEQAGVNQVLIASALHQGKITREILDNIKAPA